MVEIVWILRTSFKDVTSRRTRLLLTVSGIAIGVALLFALISITSGISVRSTAMIRQLTTADIVIRNVTGGSRQGFFTRSYINESVVNVIANISGIYAATPTLTVSASLNNTPIMLQGIDPHTFSVVNSGLNIVSGNYFSCMNCSEALVGQPLSERYNITVGNIIHVMVGGRLVNLTIVGIYESAQLIGVTSIYVPIKFLQEISGNIGLVSEILIKLDDPSMANQVASAITSAYPDLRASVMSTQTQQATQILSTLTLFFLTIGSIAIVAGGFGVANTMLINVFERSREIGILRAIGAGSKIILLLFITESVLVGVIGGLVGIIGGVVLAYVLPNVFPMTTMSRFIPGTARVAGQITQSILTPVMSWENVVLSVAIGVIVSFVAGLYPAWRASRIKPVEVLRYG